MIVGNKERSILVNEASLKKRLPLPDDLIEKISFSTMVRLVWEKIAFQSSGPQIDIRLDESYTKRICFEAVQKFAQGENRWIRLSKKVYDLPRSIDVLPSGVIAVDTGRVLGEGANAKARSYQILGGSLLARRSETVDIDKQQAVIEKTIKIYEQFQDTPGIISALHMGFYPNKKGKCKFITYFPLFTFDLHDYFCKIWIDHKRPFKMQKRLIMARQLLQGLSAIAKKGAHRDLSLSNIFLSIKKVQAVIADLEFFTTQENAKSASSQMGPDNFAKARDVWDMGRALYYLFQNQFEWFPWERSHIEGIITQEAIDQSIEESQFPKDLELMLRGMLVLDPTKRWNAQEALEYFEKIHA